MTLPLRVLFIEDSEGDVALLVIELTQGGWEPSWTRVETAEGLREALESPWDLVLSDYSLPGLEAAAALEMVRRRQADVPFLIVSGVIGEEAAAALMKAGANDFINKNKSTRLVPAVGRELREAQNRKQRLDTESRLRDSEERLRLAVDVAQMGTWDWDMLTDEVKLSDKLHELSGLTPQTFAGTYAAALALVHADDRSRVEQAVVRALENDVPFHVEYRFVAPGGEVRWSETRGRVFRDPEGRPLRMIGVLHDITDRKHAEEERRHLLQQERVARAQAEQAMEQLQDAHQSLHTLSKRLLEVQESERRHIACELHDEIGQALTAGIINLQIVQRAHDALAGCPELHESITLLETTLQQVRTMSLDLRPSLLDDLGLLPALRWYLNRQAQRAGFSFQLVGDTRMPRLAADVETVCFRVVQEAVTNIVRHARAQNVRVELRKTDPALELEVTDDGAGFDVTAARSQASNGLSLGLLSMHERVALAGGRFTIKSAPGQGTVIRARLPLPEAVPGNIVESEA
jgi:two-component system sensor histidine kinase UhpB